MAELEAVHPEKNEISTDIGKLSYDYLVFVSGAKTNFFGNVAIEKNSMQMKSAPDSLFIRNRIQKNFEKALS